MSQRTRRDHPEMLRGDLARPVVGRECTRPSEQGELPAHAIGAHRRTEFGCGAEHRVRDRERIDLLACALHMPTRVGIGFGPLRGEPFGITVVGIAPLDHLDALIEIGGRRDFHGEAKAIEELRTEITLFGIPTADEDEACGMAHTDPLALDDVLPGGGDIEQEIDEVILEEVDLVDVEVPAIRAREEPGFVRLLAAGERAFEVEGADHAILGGAEREVDDGDGGFVGAELLAGVQVRLAVGAEAAGRRLGITSVAAPIDHRHRGEEGGEGADRGGLGGPAMAEDQHPTDGRVDRGEEDGPLHLVLTDDGREGEGDTHQMGLRGEGVLYSREIRGLSQYPDSSFCSCLLTVCTFGLIVAVGTTRRVLRSEWDMAGDSQWDRGHDGVGSLGGVGAG